MNLCHVSDEGIIHQTTCPGTPPQNGVAERESAFARSGKISDVPDECTKVSME